MAVRFRTSKRQTLPARPRPGIIVTTHRDDFQIETGRIRLDPSKMGRILRNADVGDTEEMFEMFSAVEEDPHVHSVLSKRYRAVTSRKLTIEVDEGLADDAQAVRAAELCNDLVFGAEGQGGIGNLHEALCDLTNAVGRGFSLSQIEWDTRGDFVRPVALHHWPNRETQIGDPFTFDILRSTGERHRRADEVRILTDDQPVRGEELQPGLWVLHVHKARAAPLHRAALLRIVAWWFLYKHFAAKDWAIFLERYGMPTRIGRHPVGASEDERGALKEAVLDLGKDAAAIVPEGSDIEFVESKVSAGTSQPHEKKARFCDEQISKAVMGTTLTTEATERGARSLGEVHEKQQIAMSDDDALRLALTLQRDLMTPIVRFNLGDDFPIPVVKLTRQSDEDLNARANRDATLVTDIGLPVARSYFYETYGIPEPADDDELVSPSAAAPPGGGAVDEPPSDVE